MNFRLTPQQRYRLRQTRDTTHDADILRRSLALLLLDQGRSVATIAIELGVSRQSVYNWLDRYLLRRPPRRARWPGLWSCYRLGRRTPRRVALGCGATARGLGL